MPFDVTVDNFLSDFRRSAFDGFAKILPVDPGENFRFFEIDLVNVQSRLFTATGMRREEIINLGAGDGRIEEDQILIHTRVKGGVYEWRKITDEEVKAALERYLRLAKRKSTIGRKGRDVDSL